uniref:Uncharacterized protein n=1 Tax=Eutreptiella gymnastica TaxID=73025 RepID=A0A7S1JAI9_9EUGL|mmetsp:Transcript_79592/g.140466  ORF Transcript_79592/g.140466 Transcript_79592/m.140466 type:complete len:239 (+) Transcript_79592:62-778(+)
MSRWQKDLALKVALYEKSMVALRDLSKSTVRGRYGGITIVYDGLGRVQQVQADPSQCEGLYTADKKLNVQYLQKGVSEAMLDACEQMRVKKKMYWRDVDPRQDFELMENLPPFPFDLQALEQAPASLAVDHLPDGIYDPKYQDPALEYNRRMEEQAKEKELYARYRRALTLETALRKEAFTKRVPLAQLRKMKQSQARRIKAKMQDQEALEARVKRELQERKERKQKDAQRLAEEEEE